MSHGEAMILVMGTAEDQHAAAIYNKIIARGNRVAYFDPRLYPKDMTITFDSALPMAGTIRYRDGQSAVDLSLVNSVYCRHWDDLLVTASAMGTMPDAVELRETEASLGSMFRGMECYWVNPIDSLINARYRIRQLQLIRTQGVRVPEVIVSNDFRRVQAFFSLTNEQLQYRPSGWHSSSWNCGYIDEIARHLSDLPVTPVEYQEIIAGDEVRAYVIGESVFSGLIEPVTNEFAAMHNDYVRPIELPAEAKRICRRVAATLDLRFCAIDMRITPEGEYAVVDVDANPMFLHFEQTTRLPISDRLVELLIATDVDAYDSRLIASA